MHYGNDRSFKVIAMGWLYLLLLLISSGFVCQARGQDLGLPRDHRDRMLNLFQRLDINKDAKLTADELSKYPHLRSIYRNAEGVVFIKNIIPDADFFVGERLLSAFHKADNDGDFKLNKAELRALPGIQSRFNRFDRNRDGLISIDEFLWLRKSLAPRN